MLIEITNNTLDPITTTINNSSYTIKAGNISETIDVGEFIPQNLIAMKERGFIRIEEKTNKERFL